jgi:hypothetical protein
MVQDGGPAGREGSSEGQGDESFAHGWISGAAPSASHPGPCGPRRTSLWFFTESRQGRTGV